MNVKHPSANFMKTRGIFQSGVLIKLGRNATMSVIWGFGHMGTERLRDCQEKNAEWVEGTWDKVPMISHLLICLLMGRVEVCKDTLKIYLQYGLNWGTWDDFQNSTLIRVAECGCSIWALHSDIQLYSPTPGPWLGDLSAKEVCDMPTGSDFSHWHKNTVCTCHHYWSSFAFSRLKKGFPIYIHKWGRHLIPIIKGDPLKCHKILKWKYSWGKHK